MSVFKYFCKRYLIIFILAAFSLGFSSSGSYSLRFIPNRSHHTVNLFFVISKAKMVQDGINPFFADLYLKNLAVQFCEFTGIINQPDVLNSDTSPIDPSEAAVLHYQCSEDYFILNQQKMLELPTKPLNTRKIQPLTVNHFKHSNFVWPDGLKIDSLLHAANKERSLLYRLGIDAYLTVYIVGGVNALDLSVIPDDVRPKQAINQPELRITRHRESSYLIYDFVLGTVTPDRLIVLTWLEHVLKDFFFTASDFEDVSVLSTWSGKCRIRLIIPAESYYPAFPDKLSRFLTNKLVDMKQWYGTDYAVKIGKQHKDTQDRDFFLFMSDYYLHDSRRYFQIYVPGMLPVQAIQQELMSLIGQL